MMCRNPYTRGIHAYPCGQCMPCRLNRRRLWTHRIMLETLDHGDCTFVTLTYSDQYLQGNTSLSPIDLQLWLKRLRFSYLHSSMARLTNRPRLRYYAVGEYGDQTQRPHYHVALFGYPNCRRIQSRFRKGSCCPPCDLILSTWAKGQVFLGSLELHSAQYIAGYVTKKMTKSDDPRLNGRYPEFCRMSLKPGIGLNHMHDVASTLLNLASPQGDVPVSLRHGGRQLPLGRYLRRKLRTMIGKDEKAPTTINEEMLSLLQAAQADKQNPSFKAHLIASGNQKALNAIGKSKLKRNKHL